MQAVLAARIDRLAPEEKAFLQQLSVIGRQFPLSLIRQVITQPEADLYRLLASLQHKEFLYEQPAFPESEYIFKHALTQEVAYGTVLQDKRKALHERTGQALETLYAEKLVDHYSDLAHHYTRSGNSEKAIEYLHLAGQQAVQRSANAEAITQLTTALELLKTLPNSPARTQRELRLQVALGVPLMAVRGFSSSEAKAAYTRARELCQQVEETRQLFRVLLGLRTFHQARAELLVARELGEQILSLAQKEQEPTLCVEAYRALGSTFFHLGEFSTARVHLEQGLILYDAQRRHFAMARPGFIEPGVMSLKYVDLALWHLGYPDQAIRKSEAALTLAREVADPFSLSLVQDFAAVTHQLRRETLLTHKWAEAGVTLAGEQGFPLWLAQGTVLQGWALAEQGQMKEGIARIHQGLAMHETIGAGLLNSYFLTLLAEAQGKAGQVDEGLATLTEALRLIEENEERFYEAEVWRLKGELVLQSAVHSPLSETPNSQHLTPSTQAEVEQEAEEYFLKAIAIAQKQQAKSLELRAATSLARLWQSQGKTTEARDLLAPVYHWFTEGFDTKDLQEAKALLAALSE